MPAQAWPRIKGVEAERLGRSRLDDLPDIDAHAQAEQLELIDQLDVDAAVDIFEKLGHLRCRWARDRHGAVEDLSVECLSHSGGYRILSANYFGPITTTHRVLTAR